MMRKKSTKYLWAAAVCAVFAFNGIAKADSTATLPKGVRGFTLGMFDDHVQREFDSKGNDRELGYYFNEQDVTGFATPIFNSLIGAPQGTPSVNMAMTYADADVYMRAWVFGFEYGVTDNLSVAVGFPYIVHARTDIDFETYLYPNQAIDPSLPPVINMTGVAQQVIQDQFGFKKINTWTGTPGIGDIKLGYKYRFLNQDMWKAAFGGWMVLPTGEPDDEKDQTDIRYGMGHYDLAAFGMVDIVPVDPLTVNFTARYVYTFPYHRAIYVLDPNNPEFYAAELKTKRVFGDFDTGDYYELETEMFFDVTDWLQVWGGYNYHQSWEDRIDGDSVPISEVIARKAWYGLTLSSVDAYASDNAALPMEWSIWNEPMMTGQNTLKTNRWVTTFKFYF